MGKFIDCSGKRYGKLTVIKLHGTNKQGLKTWLCKCDCGNKTIVPGSILARGRTLSCGCLVSERTIEFNLTHNMTHTRIYNIWAKMKKRCLNPNTAHYEDYGGRGIKVCDKWMGFEGFYEDMKDSYSDKLTLDRIDVNGDYEKSNCRWATRRTQSNNRRSNRYVTYNGVTDTLSNICRMNNVKRELVKDRLKLGWSLERALTEPTHNTKPKRA